MTNKERLNHYKRLIELAQDIACWTDWKEPDLLEQARAEREEIREALRIDKLDNLDSDLEEYHNQDLQRFYEQED